jgi:hypothetical protein
MFTGKPAHRADSMAELLKLRRNAESLTNPSQLAADIDPAVERAILRCLDADPKNRPASAMALAASLPGGDPLAAALAAGETPSPEVVAASGSSEGLSPKVAIPVLAAVLAGLAVTCVLMPKIQVAGYVPLENPPEALTVKAREIVRSLGYTARPADSQGGFYYDVSAGQGGRLKAAGPEEWRKVIAQLPSPVLYGYRQSPAALVSQRYLNSGRVNGNDPVPNIVGMVQLTLDPGGHLLLFDAVPPQVEKPGAYPAPDWAPLFAAANFDVAQFKPDEPQWTPLAATDIRAAWTGKYPGVSDLPIRIEVGAFHGRPVHFEVVFPWTRPARVAGARNATLAQQAATLSQSLLSFLVMGIAAVLARFNFKAGRGDLRGASRLGIYMGSVSLLKWALSAHHVADAQEQNLVTAALADAAYSGLRYWIFYLALEPWVRRYWPQTLVTWSRLLAGRWRDPWVGRDVLFGCLLGVAYGLLFQSFMFLNLMRGAPPETSVAAANLNGTRFLAWTVARHLDDAVGAALYFFLILFLLRAVLRKQWLAGVAFVLIYVAMRSPALGVWYAPFFVLAIWTLLVVAMLRFGVFATMCLVFFIDTPPDMYFTMDFSAWYGQSSWVVLAIVIAAAAWGFRTSLGGRPLIPALKT